MRKELFICECQYAAHQMVVSYDDQDNDGWDEVYVEIHLSTYMGFWKRLWHGLKYIFGYKSTTGAFDGLTLDPDDVDRLQSVVDYLKITKINKDEDRRPNTNHELPENYKDVVKEHLDREKEEDNDRPKFPDGEISGDGL